MNDDYEDGIEDLIHSEKLNLFSVVESFCVICSDITPHHLEDNSSYDDESSHADASLPLSILSCVICRENEESELPSF